MPSYSFNKNYFDSIDSPDKAYWLGFIWGDGCVMKRTRGNSVSYEFKVGLSEKDDEHLYKLRNALESTHDIKHYVIQRGFDTTNRESRLYISNKYFGEVLHNKYGIVKDRTDFSKVVSNVPEEYYPDLIRGLIDSDGCIASREIQYKTTARKEFGIDLIASISVLDFYNNVLITNGITTTKYKPFCRHKNADGSMLSIRITGNNKTYSILEWIYKDKQDMSLSRKYSKYIDIKNYMNEYINETRGIKNGKGNIILKE